MDKKITAIAILCFIFIVGCESNFRKIGCDINSTGIIAEDDSICFEGEWMDKEYFSMILSLTNQSFFNGYNKAINDMASSRQYPVLDVNQTITIMNKQQLCGNT